MIVYCLKQCQGSNEQKIEQPVVTPTLLQSFPQRSFCPYEEFFTNKTDIKNLIYRLQKALYKNSDHKTNCY